MGDSFTAGHLTYAALLQQSFPRVRIINARVSGTGIIQTEVMARKRFEAFHPSIFIYQIYAGNDLFDVNYPMNWDEVSFSRNLYWMMANHLRVVGDVNYRLGQTLQPQVASGAAAGASTGTGSTKNNDSFSVEKYEGRVKRYLKADPSLLEDSIVVKGRRAHDYFTLLNKLEKLTSYCGPKRCEAIFW